MIYLCLVYLKIYLKNYLKNVHLLSFVVKSRTRWILKASIILDQNYPENMIKLKVFEKTMQKVFFTGI